MSVTTIIKTKGIFDKVPVFRDILKPGWDYGTWDGAFRIEPGNDGAYTLLYKKDMIARGINIGLGERSLVTIKMSSPTTEQEIRDYYDYISYLCGKMEVSAFDRNGTKYVLGDIEELVDKEIEESKVALAAIEGQMEDSNISSMYIFGVTNPIAISREDIKNIGKDLGEFARFLNCKQQYTGIYAAAELKPLDDNNQNRRRRLFGRDDIKKETKYIATFKVPANTDVIFPTVKRVLSKKQDSILGWKVVMGVSATEREVLNFDTFVQKINKDRPYDAEHVFINITPQQMEEWAEQDK